MEMQELISPGNVQMVTSAALAALLTWLATSGRRAIKNIGKTKVEIAQSDLERAMVRFMEAKATADPQDDIVAQQALDKAQSEANKAQIIKAVTDAADPGN